MIVPTGVVVGFTVTDGATVGDTDGTRVAVFEGVGVVDGVNVGEPVGVGPTGQQPRPAFESPPP